MDGDDDAGGVDGVGDITDADHGDAHAAGLHAGTDDAVDAPGGGAQRGQQRGDGEHGVAAAAGDDVWAEGLVHGDA